MNSKTKIYYISRIVLSILENFHFTYFDFGTAAASGSGNYLKDKESIQFPAVRFQIFIQN